jgi:hypothetical protein
VLQHQFWDLAVTDKQFEIGLSFGGVPEKLVVPFDAIKGFYDPSVQFGLQFEIAADAQATTEDAANQADGTMPAGTISAAERRPAPRGAASEPEEMPKAAGRSKKKDSDAAAKKSGKDGAREDGMKEDAGAQPSAQVVSLDKFRKK